MVQTTSCEKCGSKDNLKIFDNGSTYCFTPGCGKNKDKTLIFQTGEYQLYRGLSIDTCIQYDYQLKNDLRILTYKDHITSHPISQKHKSNQTKGLWINYDKDKISFYGMHLAVDYSLPLVITEGEEDAMSVYQATKYQAVSLSSGAASALKSVTQWKEVLNRFKQIILLFDNDDAGKSAVQQIKDSGLIKKNLYIAQLKNYKDANEALQAGDVEAIRDALDNAKEDRPEGIVFGNELLLDPLLIPETTSYRLPFKETERIIRGLKPGRLYLVGAGTGCGKSTFVKEIVVNLMENYPQLRIANFFLEESQKYTLKSLIGIRANIPPYLLEDFPDVYTKEISEGFEFLKKDNLMFLDHFGSLNSSRLFASLEYLADSKKYDVIIFDHISMAVSGLSSKEGERKDIDILMTKLREMVAKYNLLVLAVSHLKRPETDKGYEDGKQITLHSFRGSGSLAQLSDVVIGLEINQQKQFHNNEVKVRILKNRITGKVGLADTLYYFEDRGRLLTLNKVFMEDNHALE